MSNSHAFWHNDHFLKVSSTQHAASAARAIHVDQTYPSYMLFCPVLQLACTKGSGMNIMNLLCFSEW